MVKLGFKTQVAVSGFKAAKIMACEIAKPHASAYADF